MWRTCTPRRCLICGASTVPAKSGISGYYSTREFTQSEFRARAAELGCALDADVPLVDQVRVEALTDAGQVAVLRIGDGALSGRQARKGFSLRSQCFDVVFDSDGGVIFDVRGFGHGVGMSQNGATQWRGRAATLSRYCCTTIPAWS